MSDEDRRKEIERLELLSKTAGSASSVFTALFVIGIVIICVVFGCSMLN